MSTKRIGLSWKLALFLCVSAGIALLMLFGTGRNLSDSLMTTASQEGNGNGGSLLLQAPSFVNVASAEELGTSGISSVIEDAGFTAYYQHSEAINLDHVRNQFQVIEDETDSYIIGYLDSSLYGEGYNPHVYVSTDGWIVAYNFASGVNPTAKAFPIATYRSTGRIEMIPELAVKVITRALDVEFPEVNYYHFSYPNSTHMMFIIDRASSYTVNIPSHLIVDEFSAKAVNSIQNYLWSFYIDDVNQFTGYGSIDPAILTLGQEHTIRVDINTTGVLILLYSEG